MADLTDNEIRSALAEVAQRPDAPDLVALWDDAVQLRDLAGVGLAGEGLTEASAFAVCRLIARQHVAEKALRARLEKLAARWEDGTAIRCAPCARELRAALEE